jgi:hypothetical protein
VDRYLNDWSCVDDVQRDFQIDEFAVLDEEVLVASYEQANYEGHAYVLFTRYGRLFEVHGSHCSCYGLEGQWEPEETSAVEILHRLDEGTYFHESQIAAQVREALAINDTEVSLVSEGRMNALPW